VSDFMEDNTTKKVAHTTNNKDRRLLQHDVERVGGMGAVMKRFRLLTVTDGDSFLDRWLRRLGLKDC